MQQEKQLCFLHVSEIYLTKFSIYLKVVIKKKMKSTILVLKKCNNVLPKI